VTVARVTPRPDTPEFVARNAWLDWIAAPVDKDKREPWQAMLDGLADHGYAVYRVHGAVTDSALDDLQHAADCARATVQRVRDALGRRGFGLRRRVQEALDG
jgi:hypothetical protein